MMDDSSPPQTEEITATETLTSPLPSLSSSDSLPVPTLPLELVEDILCRLPVKFLMQLQCVCKSWKSLISDPEFSKKHFNKSTPCHKLISTPVNNRSREVTIGDYPIPSVDAFATVQKLQYPLNSQYRVKRLVGSCDGILCFSINNNYAFLWNPSIRKFKELPCLDNPTKPGHTVYAFGYDNYTHEYKVVAAFCHKYYSVRRRGFVFRSEVKVYTLGTNCWRSIQNEFPRSNPLSNAPGKFFNGTVNWLAFNDAFYSLAIVSLDLRNESYQDILVPFYRRGISFFVLVVLSVLRDCLCILYNTPRSFDIWVMKEYGNKESWTKMFTVPTADLPRPLYVSEEDDNQVLLTLGSDLGEFLINNASDGTFKAPDILNIMNDVMIGGVYIESLIWPC